MKKYLIIFTIVHLYISAKSSMSQDTFSIVAIDTVTGQVGSAGASCIQGSIILSDVHPGRGVIHTQASYQSGNQGYARTLMNMGLSPQQIIDSVVAHDVQGNPTIRQYGIVDLVGGGRTAAYTGINCLNYKNHILGRTYSIQGNILLGQKILDSMQARFLRTGGTLANRLMAALQGAKVIGADTRCAGRNTSSISAFLRVGRPQDTLGPLFLDLNVNNTPVNKDPIDSLQVRYNNWLTEVKNISSEIPQSTMLYQNYPNPFNPVTAIKFSVTSASKVELTIYDVLGNRVVKPVDENLNAGSYEVMWNAGAHPSGVYYYKLEVQNVQRIYSETKRMILLK